MPFADSCFVCFSSCGDNTGFPTGMESSSQAFDIDGKGVQGQDALEVEKDPDDGFPVIMNCNDPLENPMSDPSYLDLITWRWVIPLHPSEKD